MADPGAPTRDRFALRPVPERSRSFLIPPADHAGFARALRRLVVRERVDLLIPTTDAEVVRLASARRGWRCRLFLPGARTVALCQDKYVLARHLGARGVPVPRTLPLAGVRSVGDAYRRLGRPTRAWCRIRRGSNASGRHPGGHRRASAELDRVLGDDASSPGVGLHVVRISPRPGFRLSEPLAAGKARLGEGLRAAGLHQRGRQSQRDVKRQRLLWPGPWPSRVSSRWP